MARKRKTAEEKLLEEFDGDPEFQPDTPESDAEIFHVFKDMGMSPEDLEGKDQVAYRKYLAKHPD